MAGSRIFIRSSKRAAPETAAVAAGGTEQVVRSVPAGAEPQTADYSRARERTPVMPLAALLPPAGDLTQLEAARANLLGRLRELRDEEAPASAESDSKERQCEEAMLNQVAQWLSISGSAE